MFGSVTSVLHTGRIFNNLTVSRVRSWGSVGSISRLDVLIQMEEVFGVVFGFYLDQPIVVIAKQHVDRILVEPREVAVSSIHLCTPVRERT